MGSRTVSLKNMILWSAFSLSFIAFMHAVTAFASSTTLAWNPPTTNTDGTPLTDLAGYKIYYGTTSGSYTNTIDVGNVTTSVLNNLTDGLTYFFSVTAYDSAGVASSFSNEVSKTMTASQFTLTTTKSGTGTGTLTSSPAGITCGTTCAGGFNAGTSVTLTASPDASSIFGGWSGVCTGTGACTVFLDAAKTVTAAFTLKTFSITTTAGIGGTISGTTAVNYGANETITIAPSAGYHVATVLVDGVSIGAVTAYAFTNVTANHTIAASFAINTYTIIASSGTGGTISPSGALSASYGTNQAVTIAPSAGYHVAKVLVDGVSIGAVTAHTFTNVTANHTIAASFAINTYTIIASAGTGGAISPSGALSASYGGNAIFSITPNTGYMITAVKVDGVSSGAMTTYTFANITMNHIISATFGAIPVSPSLTCPDPGIPCVERADGLPDGNNLVNNKPKVDVEFEFQTMVVDPGGSPQYVRLFMSQRSAPVSGDFFRYDMNCSGNFSTGAICTYTTGLGPAANHKFYIEAKLSDGSLVDYPQAGYIDGPQIQMLNGDNLVGAPRDLSGVLLDGTDAFGTDPTYRWISRITPASSIAGYFEPVDATKPPVKPGEGYLVSRSNNPTLLGLDRYPNLLDGTFAVSLKQGWNLISNPYDGNVKLADLQVKKGTNAAVSWSQAISNNWLTNAVCYSNGSDWGDTDSCESVGSTGTTDTKLVPWRAYWMYLKEADAAYSLVIPKP